MLPAGKSNELFVRGAGQTWDWSDLGITTLTRVYDEDTVRINTSDAPLQSKSIFYNLRLCSQPWMPCHLTITGAMHRRAETIFCGEEDLASCTGITLWKLTLRCSKHFRSESGPLQVSGSSAKLQVINSSIFDCAATEDGGSLRVMDGALLEMSDS